MYFAIFIRLRSCPFNQDFFFFNLNVNYILWIFMFHNAILFNSLSNNQSRYHEHPVISTLNFHRIIPVFLPVGNFPEWISTRTAKKEKKQLRFHCLQIVITFPYNVRDKLRLTERSSEVADPGKSFILKPKDRPIRSRFIGLENYYYFFSPFVSKIVSPKRLF